MDKNQNFTPAVCPNTERLMYELGTSLGFLAIADTDKELQGMAFLLPPRTKAEYERTVELSRLFAAAPQLFRAAATMVHTLKAINQTLPEDQDLFAVGGELELFDEKWRSLAEYLEAPIAKKNGGSNLDLPRFF